GKGSIRRTSARTSPSNWSSRSSAARRMLLVNIFNRSRVGHLRWSLRQSGLTSFGGQGTSCPSPRSPGWEHYADRSHHLAIHLTGFHRGRPPPRGDLG